jgi:nucleoside phosphorylase
VTRARPSCILARVQPGKGGLVFCDLLTGGIARLQHHRSGSPPKMMGDAQTTMSTKVAVVLTAIQVETEAVLRHLVDRGRERVVDTWFQTGRFDRWTVAIAEVGPGNARAATIAVRAFTHFRPEIAAFVGVAGRLKDVQLGDVVVATKVYNYESGKEIPGGFQVRPDLQTSHHELEQRARVLCTGTNWYEKLDSALWSDRKPTVHVGPIAAGEAVVANNKGRIAAHLKQHYGDALAVEMEGRGFLEAAHIESGCRAVVVRGISDPLTGKARADKLGWQRRAADSAAAFFFEMLALGTDPGFAQTPPGAFTSVVDDNRRTVDSVIRPIRDFREERVAKIAKGEFPQNVKVHDGSKMVLHAIPSNAFSENDQSIDVERVFRREQLYLPPLGVTGYNGLIFNLYGAVTTNARLGDITTAYAYLFRSGAIEGVYRFGVDEDNNSFIVAPPFEQQVTDTLKNYLKIAKKLEMNLPICVFLSFCNMRGCRLRDVREGLGFYNSQPFSEEIIAPKEVIIENNSVDLSIKMDDLFTIIWNAFGFRRS